MILKILKKDFLRKKVVTIAVFVFILLAAMLISSGTNMLIDLDNSLEHLFKASSAPHFIQHHSGKINQDKIDRWIVNNSYVKSQQTSEMINIHGSKVYINSDKAESHSVMDLDFVKQNKSFDYLLDLNNEIIEVSKGEIAVPIYYMQRRDLSLGDKVVIKDGDLKLSFTITSFIRDVQMNPSIISSKRFVVNSADFEKIKDTTGDIEYQISFQLNDLDNLRQFSNQYTQSDLPKKGPTIDYSLLKLANSITDGLIAAVIILISLLLNVIALLCLRFIILLTIEEDYKEIGVMKAIGISPPNIKRIYLSKYFTMALSATLIGYLISLFINDIFSKNIMLYIGTAPKTIIEYSLPLVAALLIAIIVVLFCFVILRRFNKISAIEAIRLGNTGETYSNNKRLALYKNKMFNPNIFLGLRDIILRFRLYALLFIVFILSTFMITVPLNFLNTIQSPEFITYMGVGKSDIILDIRQSDQIVKKLNEVVNYIENDPDVKKYSPYITSQYEIINEEGLPESILVETGDFSVFPLDYLEGVSPKLSNEIALSYLCANQFKKQVGDEVKLLINEKPRLMIVTGIYQDITDGGKTAKANISPDYETASWYTINVNVNKNVAKKVLEYENKFDNVKVSNPKEYFKQTFSSTINQLKLLTITAIIIAILVTILITSLFLKMVIAKDMSQIAIKRSIGISLRNIKIEYITKAFVTLNLGILLGTVISNTLGERLLSAVLSIVGAPNIEFIINPLEVYIISPISMIIIVIITTLVSINFIKEFSISDINAE
ncbi:MAG: ABC transporter permease [Firmicutes bacterium]|nr:ABC transporter permease [Bacillota bacterium]